MTERDFLFWLEGFISRYNGTLDEFKVEISKKLASLDRMKISPLTNPQPREEQFTYPSNPRPYIPWTHPAHFPVQPLEFRD